MKKTLIIPILTAASLTPLVSLASCQEDISIYQVPEEEMEDIIKLKDVVYLQTHQVDASEMVETIWDTEYSPNCFHKLDASFLDKYVVHESDGTYTYYYLYSSQGIWYKEKNVSSDKFETVSNVGKTNLYSFNMAFMYETSYVFDKKNKCYSATFNLEQHVVCTNSFYFKNKKLIRINEQINGQTMSDTTFFYKEFVPKPPPI